MEKRTCAVEGCNRTIGAKSAGVCLSCYQKQWRIDRPARVARGEIPAIVTAKTWNETSDGYRRGWAPDHALAKPNSGMVLEHRIIAYEKYGDGDQTCHWCGDELAWEQVHVDHLDWDRSNNHPDNLVTSCARCNMTRKTPADIAAIKKASETSKSLRSLVRRLND